MKQGLVVAAGSLLLLSSLIGPMALAHDDASRVSFEREDKQATRQEKSISYFS